MFLPGLAADFQNEALGIDSKGGKNGYGDEGAKGHAENRQAANGGKVVQYGKAHDKNGSRAWTQAYRKDRGQNDFPACFLADQRRREYMGSATLGAGLFNLLKTGAGCSPFSSGAAACL